MLLPRSGQRILRLLDRQLPDFRRLQAYPINAPNVPLFNQRDNLFRLNSEQQLLASAGAKMATREKARSEFTANPSAPLVFPIASLAFCYPCDRCGEALSSGLLA